MKNKAPRAARKLSSIFSFLLWLLLIFLNYHLLKDQIKPSQIDATQLQIFKVELAQDIKPYDPNSGSNYLRVYGKGMEDLEFYLPYPYFNYNIAYQLSTGDKIFLAIELDDFEKYV